MTLIDVSKVGSEADCGDPMCCLAANGRPKNPMEGGAGPAGEYTCDVPLWSLDKMVREIKVNETDFFHPFNQWTTYQKMNNTHVHFTLSYT